MTNPRDLPIHVWHGPSFQAGVRAVTPAALGAIPYGLITGFVMMNAGFGPWQAISINLMIYSGAAQLAMADLVTRHAPLVVIIFTLLVMNLRFLMYGASIGAHFKGASLPKKALLSFLLVDPPFALSMTEFSQAQSRVHRVSYYMGAALTNWSAWHSALACGVLLGASLPQEWGFDFIMPLVFLALLMIGLCDVPGVVAAVVGGGVMVLCVAWPYNLGLLAAVVCGVAAGAVTAQVRGHRADEC